MKNEYCPNCGIGLDTYQQKACFCNNCNEDWSDEREDDRSGLYDTECSECGGINGKHAIDCPETPYGHLLKFGYD